MVSLSTALSGAGRAWERFLFRPLDARRLGFFRAVFGAYLLYYYLDLFQFLHLYFFPPGLLPPAELEAAAQPNVLAWVRYGTFPRLSAYLLTVAAAVCLAIGLQTRLAAFLCWILHQAWLGIPAGRNSGDNAVAVACFLFLLAALAGHAQRAVSFDSRFRRARDEATIPAWPLRLFQVQLVYIYFFSGFHKLASQDWYLGEALFYVLQQRGWSRFDFSWFTHPIPVGLATYGTLLFELVIFPVFVWMRKIRPWVLLAGVAFHLGIGTTMRVFVFGEIMPLLYLSFVDPRPFLGWVSTRWRALQRQRPRRNAVAAQHRRPAVKETESALSRSTRDPSG
ncbi:MAG TPA: HTTM domain-containing protein [Polyangiaceae bacterium]